MPHTPHATGQRRSPMAQMAVWSVVPGLTVTVLAALVAWAVTDGGAGLSALLGGLLSVGVFAAGLFAIRGVLAGPSGLSMAGAFGVLILQLAVTAAVLLLLVQLSWVHLLLLGMVFIAVGLVFQVGALVGYLRSRMLVFEPAQGADTRPEGLS